MWHEITIIGTVGREPDMRYTADGKGSCSFSVASNRKLANGQEETIWFKVTLFAASAEFAKNYVHKGQKVLAIGRLVFNAAAAPEIYTRNDGTTSAAFEVVAEKFRIIDYGNRQDSKQSQPKQEVKQSQEEIPW